MLCTAFGEVLSCATTFRWFLEFDNGQTLVQDITQGGHLSSSTNNATINCIQNVVCAKQCLTIHEVTEADISYSSSQLILIYDLVMCSVSKICFTVTI
jgi:hypothetical protein